MSKDRVDQGPGQLRALFRNREFLAYFIARQSGWFATSISDVAIGWQVYAIRHRAFDLGLVGLIAFLPMLLFALPAGVLADRVDRRALNIGFNIVNLLCSLFFIWLALTSARSIGAWFGTLAIQSTAFAIAVPAQRSILAQIVQGERFLRASALTSSFGQLVIIAGPAVAGLLIAVDVPFAFAAAAIAQLVTAVAYAFLSPRPPEPSAHANVPMLQSALQGARYIYGNKVILGAISLDLFAVLFGGATALLPVFATQILHVGALGFGLLRAAPAVGAFVMAILLARHPIRRHAGRLLFWCVSGFGIFTIVFGLSRSFWLSFAALALADACDVVSVTIRNALVQLGTPDELRGRVSAVENIFIGASNELGAFESGAVASLIGAAPSVVLGGVGTLIVIALWTALFPSLRKFDRLT